MSSRFSESLGRPCLKCLYHESGIEDSLLYNILHQNGDFDQYIVVGGFQYEELEAAVKEHFTEYGDKFLLVRNEHFADYGSGYSLYLGLKELLKMDFDEAVFAEGDLFVDRKSFRGIYENPCNVITRNREEILASKAVAYYFDQNWGIHYIYDTAHGALEIKEPFLGIFNSGQIWKFADAEHLRQTFAAITEQEWQGTNLVFIQKYFETLNKEDYDIITFDKWVNCNTVSDYRKAVGHENTEGKTESAEKYDHKP